MQRPASWAMPVRAKSWDGVAGGKYHLINTLPLWNEFYEQLKIKRAVACDTETSGLSHVQAKIVGFSFSWGAEHSYYIPVRHHEGLKEKQLDIDVIRDDLIAFFQDPKRSTIWHNFKFDGHFLIEEDMVPKGIVHDTRLQRSLLNEEQSTTALKKLAIKEIHPQADKWEAAVDEYRAAYGRKHKIPKRDVHYGYLPLDLMVPYAASDAHYTWALYKKQLPQIIGDTDLRELYLMESQLLWVLLNIEHNGVFVDRNYLNHVGPDLEKKAAELHAKIRNTLGDVNPDSNVTLIEPLQNMGVKLYKKTKSGQRFSLDAEVLERLAAKYHVCKDIKDYRGQVKLRSTYVEGILDLLTELDKLHCEYNQAVSTGRMSSKKPNLQNIPNKDKSIRRAFIPPKNVVCVGHPGHKGTSPFSRCGFEEKRVVIPSQCPNCGGRVVTKEDYILIYMDYSQMEIRMTAHYSRDKVLLDVYNRTHQDVHTRTMCEVFGGYSYDDAVAILDDYAHKDHEELDQQRKVAKMTNFLIIYGGNAKTLAARISTPDRVYTEAECKSFMRNYFDRLKGVRRWITRTKMGLRETGWVQNHFGRYRRFPELLQLLKRSYQGGDTRYKIERAERQAVNFLIQGSCADLFKIAMVRANAALRGMQSEVIMPIHDELVFYWHRDEIDHLGVVKEKMEDFQFVVPMTVDVSYSTTNWAAKKELKLAA